LQVTNTDLLAAPRSRIPRRFRRLDEQYVEGNRIRLLRNGREAYPAMLAAIRGAARQVLLEMYWFDSDRTGRKFADALKEAASRGVEVAVIYDALGSITADGALFEELRRADVRVLEFNPIAPWKRRFRLGRLTRRDHRKLLVIDGEIGFTGGINIANPWLPTEEEGHGWRDDMVCIEGPAVARLAAMFFQAWEREQGEPLRRLGWSRKLGDDGEIPGGQRVRVLGENFFRNRHEIARAYISHLYRAERRAWISNSYFVPDPSVRRALVQAAQRGVDVRIVLPAQSDIEIVRHASRAVWGRLLRHGVRIFEWQGSILHAKTAVIDGHWSTLGTFNLDYLSVRWNLEVNVTVLDEGFGSKMEASFLADLEDCREVDPSTFRFRPLGDRLLEAVLYRFRKLM
jgi:cardiolipin synthase A/B